MLKRLHHNAYRCRDSEETRKFYSDFLGLPLVAVFVEALAQGLEQAHPPGFFLPRSMITVVRVCIGS